MSERSRRQAIRGVVGLVIVTSLVLTAACGGSGGSSSSTAAGGGSSSGSTASSKVQKVAIATPAKQDDYGWNQQGILAAKAAAGTVGAGIQVVPNIGYDNTQAVLSQLAQSGANFIVAHASGYDTIAKRVAQQYKVPIMTYDIGTELVPNEVSNITTSSQQGSYLAGILAAKTTKTGTIGIVISASDTNWYKMSGGFVAGARSVNPNVKILFAEIGSASYDDSAGGKRVADTEVAANADVIFGMGDGASFGYLQSISTANPGHKVWYIGDIGDMTPIDKQHVFLSSVLWNFTAAFNQAIKDINAGTYGQHGYDLTLQNGGISLLKTTYIPAAVWTQIETARQGIVSGSVQVPLTTTRSAVTKLIG
jgi:basic membrane protein A and related proteins